MSGILARDPSFRAPAAREEFDVSETVLRYIFDHDLAFFGGKAPTYYLTIRGQDPTAGFMARFSGHPTPVLPGSTFKLDSGLLFTIGGVHRLGVNRCEVYAISYQGPISAFGSVYQVHRTGGSWRVVSEEVKWVS